MQPMNEAAAKIISEWEYPAPYDVYNFKGKTNGYLFSRNVWGEEIYHLTCCDGTVGYVACQYVSSDLWVGWAFAPELCGKGDGGAFISACVREVRRAKSHNGAVLLRVAAWNKRAIRAYEKAGFAYVDTIIDEIANSNKLEDFHVMKHRID
jgi:Acetyltransferases, including N-acetylases of ribosomal proteins